MKSTLAPALCVLLSLTGTLLAQPLDDAYGAQIRAHTTDSTFLNELVDHLPASETVPSPLEHFGSIIGAPGVLHYTSEIYAYLRALADASPRVEVRSIGTTEEDREMIEVIVADEATIASLESYRELLNRLADPRKLSAAAADSLIDRAKPIYYVTAGLHSPETGSPEMVMELAYRLAVDERPFVKTIRDNVIFIFTPVAEPDGRDRFVDVVRYRAEHNEAGPSPTYWGHYVAHDNNRDGYGLGLALTRNLLASYLHWKPQVMHDLHESVPYLYVSTGLGPYNEHVDAITIDEWHNLAYEEVSELTRRGMPGVWTHGFYNGWAANYLVWMANVRNSIGRFYETFGNAIPDTKERTLSDRSVTKEWYRPNPPLKKTQWSFRNNTNYTQSGVLVALKYMADNRRQFVENYYLKSRRALQKGRTEAPYAWVIPKTQRRPLGTLALVNLLRDQGLEVHTATQELVWTQEDQEERAEAGSYVVRLDQPYRTLAQVLLDLQRFPEDEDPPYDDTGWTLPILHGVEAKRVDDPAVLKAPMDLLTDRITAEGGLETNRRATHYAVPQTTDDAVAVFRFRLPEVRFLAAEQAFETEGRTFEAGSFLIPIDGNPDDLAQRLTPLAQELGLSVTAVRGVDQVPVHEVEVPRLGLIHTWVTTPQDAGWWTLAFDRIGIPYAYLSEQDLATEDLSQFDVLIMPHSYASPELLVAGRSQVGPPEPWLASDAYPHIGKIDETDDQRRGMGYSGLANLKAFVSRGGVFIAEGQTTNLPIDMGITRRVSVRQARTLQVRGSVLKAEVADTTSPIIYGYPREFGVFFNQAPVFDVDQELEEFTMPDWLKDETWEQEVPRVVVRFAKTDLLMSGMLRGGAELQGKPAVIDVPVGGGHVVLFANRPVRRWNTQGSHALVFNAMLHWNDLRVGWPERPTEAEEER